MDRGRLIRGEGSPLMRQRLRLLVFLLMIALSVAFAILAYGSPVKVLPEACSGQGGTGGGGPHPMIVVCKPVTMRTPGYASVEWQYWGYASCAQIAEGFAVLVLLFPLSTSPRIVKRLYFSWLHRPLAPRFPKRLLVSLVLIGASVFVLCALMDANYYNWVHSSYRGYYLSLLQALRFESSFSLGVTAFGAWGLTVLVLSLHKGIVGSARVFGLPAILCLMSMLLVFDSGEMILNVTKFITWSAGGIGLVSNWSVLIVASFLFVYALAYRRLGLR
jgi:hypothetical protein